jgi:hypothetical protein
MNTKLAYVIGQKTGFFLQNPITTQDFIGKILSQALVYSGVICPLQTPLKILFPIVMLQNWLVS